MAVVQGHGVVAAQDQPDRREKLLCRRVVAWRACVGAWVGSDERRWWVVGVGTGRGRWLATVLRRLVLDRPVVA